MEKGKKKKTQVCLFELSRHGDQQHGEHTDIWEGGEFQREIVDAPSTRKSIRRLHPASERDKREEKEIVNAFLSQDSETPTDTEEPHDS